MRMWSKSVSVTLVLYFSIKQNYLPSTRVMLYSLEKIHGAEKFSDWSSKACFFCYSFVDSTCPDPSFSLSPSLLPLFCSRQRWFHDLAGQKVNLRIPGSLTRILFLFPSSLSWGLCADHRPVTDREGGKDFHRLTLNNSGLMNATRPLSFCFAISLPSQPLFLDFRQKARTSVRLVAPSRSLGGTHFLPEPRPTAVENRTEKRLRAASVSNPSIGPCLMNLAHRNKGCGEAKPTSAEWGCWAC